MRISTLGYVGKQGIKNIWRNKMFSLASVATMSACIFLFGLFFSILLNFQYIIRTAEEGVAITVFFDEDGDGGTEGRDRGISCGREMTCQRYGTFRPRRHGTPLRRSTLAKIRILRTDGVKIR